MNTYIVTYDITDDDRRHDVYTYLRRWGDHLQFSVFSCQLSPTDHATMVAELRQRIDCKKDQILIFDLGPSDGRGRKAVVSLGIGYTNPERHAIVL